MESKGWRDPNSHRRAWRSPISGLLSFRPLVLLLRKPRWRMECDAALYYRQSSTSADVERIQRLNAHRLAGREDTVFRVRPPPRLPLYRNLQDAASIVDFKPPP